MDAGDSECAAVQSAAGSYYRPGTYFGDRQGIVPIPPQHGKAKEGRKSFRGNPIALEMPARGKHGKPRTGFPPFPPPLEITQTRRDSHISTAPTNTYIYKSSEAKP